MMDKPKQTSASTAGAEATRSRWLRRLLWVAGAFAVYSLIGFLLLPALIKWQLVKRLPAATKRQAAVQQVKCNPWALSLTVRGLALTEADGRPFASWDELYVNFQASSLFRWAWTFDEIRLVKPVGEVILLKDGRLNVANMFESPTNAPPQPAAATAIPRVNIFRLAVTNGFVALEDRTRRSAFRTEYRPINLELRDFTTRPDSDTPYSFHAESDAGRSLTWAGDLSVQPLRSSGHLEVTAIQLRRYQPYLDDFIRAQLTNGLADVQFDYRFAAGTNGLDLVVTNGTVQVELAQVLDPDTGESVASLRGLEVQQAGFNFRQRAARLGSVKISEGAVLARLEKSGQLNLIGLLATNPPAATAPAARTNPLSPPFTVTVDDFTLEKTAVIFEDLTRLSPFKTELKPIEVSVKNFTTKPDADASYSFQLTSEAAEKLEGAGSFSIDPLRSAGEIKVAAVELKKYVPYVQDFFRGKIIAGQAAAEVPYRVALDTNGLSAEVTNLAVRLTALELKPLEGDETVTRAKELAFERVDASLEERRGRVGRFKGTGGSVLVRRGKDGAINLLGLLAVSRTNSAANSPAQPVGEAPTKPAALALGGWVLNVDEIVFDDYTVKLEDLVPTKPATFVLDQLALSLKGASTVRNTPIQATASCRFNETGIIAVRGMAKVAPLFADFEVGVTNLDLRAAQPYIDPFVRLGIVSGALSTAGKVRFQPNDPAAPWLTFGGGLRVTNFVTTDQVAFKDFVRWEDLTVTGIDAALAPNRIKIDEVRLVGPKANVLIGPDRRPNFALILNRPDTDTNAPPPGESAAKKSLAECFPVELGTLTLDRAAFALKDDSIQPPVSVGIQDLSGSIKGLSSALNTTAEVELAGKMDQQSPFSVSGRLNPFASELFVDLVLTNRNTQLTPFTSYMEKYGGHPINKGRLTTGLRYHIEGKQLKAENTIAIDQLMLGPRNNSPEATKLPVKLGVALLKDSNGRIELNIPVEGRLDDPQFKLGPIILKVVVNMLVKVATSPFKLLGALVGGGGEELSFVEFTPGTTNLLEGEVDKLAKLTKALAARPAVNLEIEGAVDPVLDREALAKTKLHEQLKAQRLQELSAKGKAPESVETFVIDPVDNDRLLSAMFLDKFGTNISAILATNELLLSATNAAATAHVAGTNAPAAKPAAAKPASTAAHRGVFGRVLGVFGLGGSSAPKRKLPPAAKKMSKSDLAALDQLTPELMETLLITRVPVTVEDFHQLMKARAQWVQEFLVKTGQVQADRLFLVAPKPIDASYDGECRANLSLN